MADISKMTKLEIARYIDNSFVLDLADDAEVYKTYIEDVKKYKFGGICVLPYHIPLLVDEMGEFCKEHNVKIGCPIGFPFGQNFTSVKMFEAQEAIKLGATQLDMACNVSALKEKRYDYYKKELSEFAKIGKENDVMTKAIIQVQHLTDEEIKLATQFVVEAEIDQVKTSTGLNVGLRPNYNDVMIIKGVLDEMKSEKTKMKFCTGSTLEAYAFIELGCESVGTHMGVDICEKLPEYQKQIRRVEPTSDY
ncbi:MAG: deoxyribose-phosphate aldolase [Suipraeoptans sp.]